MALPNPSDKLLGQGQEQNLTLKDILHFQQRTEMWSENTDVNTFRGNAEEKTQGERLEKAIRKLAGSSGEGSLESLEKQQEETSRTITDSFKRIGRAVFQPFMRLTQNLNEKAFSTFGEDMLSATDIINAGSERVVTGFKELTNGIGALGPVINSIKTGIFKAVSVVNLFIGSFQILTGLIAKSFQSLGRFLGFDLGKSDEDLKKEQEILQLEAEEAEERLNASKEALANEEARQKQEKQLDEDNLPLPVNVTSETGAPVEAKVAEKTPIFTDARGNELKSRAEEEAEKEQSNKLSELAKEMKENEKDLAKKKEANEKALNLLESKNEKKRAKGFKGLIARLNMISLMGMMKFLGFAALLGGIILALKNNVPGAITGVAEVVRRGATGLTRMVNNKVIKPFKKITGIGVPKPAAGVPGDVVPKGTKPFKFEGKTYRPGNPLPNDVKLNADGTGAQRVSGQSKAPPSRASKVARGTVKVASKALTPVAGVVEGFIDSRDNTQKFESVKAAYEAGIPIVPDPKTGQKRPMTKEEFELLEKAQKANFAGSIGRGTGAVGGAITGAAALSWLGPFGVVVGGIGGAIIGARVGDDAATGLAEAFTGTENSQEMLDKLAASVPEPQQPVEAIEAVQQEIADVQAVAKQPSSNMFNSQQVVNNNNQENISVGQTPFSNTQLEYSYGN